MEKGNARVKIGHAKARGEQVSKKSQNSRHRTSEGHHTVDGLQEMFLNQEVSPTSRRICDCPLQGHLQVITLVRPSPIPSF